MNQGNKFATSLDERWCALEDRAALGEILVDEEAELAEIPLDDLQVAEREIYEELARIGKSQHVDALRQEDEALIERVVAASSGGAPASVRPRRILVAGGIVAALAAGLLLIVSLGKAVAPSPVVAAVEVESGQAWAASGQVLDRGDPLPRARWVDLDARSCVVGPAGRICAVGSGSKLRLRELPDARAPSVGGVDLAQGAFDLDGAWYVQAGSVGLEAIEAPAVLRLEVSADRVVVTISSGRVEITGPFISTQRGAGSRFEWPVATEVVEMRTPLSTGVARADESDGADALAPEVAEIPPTPSVGKQHSKARSTHESPESMLRDARTLAASGSLRKACVAYENLLDLHPDSEEAKNARVTLGQLYLRTNRNQRARVVFRDYLDHLDHLDHSQGALEEEARWGEIQAFHRLGQQGERDEAIAALASAFPRSVYLSRAHKLAAD